MVAGVAGSNDREQFMVGEIMLAKVILNEVGIIAWNRTAVQI